MNIVTGNVINFDLSEREVESLRKAHFNIARFSNVMQCAFTVQKLAVIFEYNSLVTEQADSQPGVKG